MGTWAVDGPGTSGTVRCSWFEGGAFLVQEVDLVADGQGSRGIEHVRWDEGSQELRSHCSSGSGEVLEHTYDLTGDTLSTWFGGRDSPAGLVGTFDATGDRSTGAWHRPGGGCTSTMTRVDAAATS